MPPLPRERVLLLQAESVRFKLRAGGDRLLLIERERRVPLIEREECAAERERRESAAATAAN